MLCLLAAGCSTTSRVPDDDKLFVGLEKIKYLDYEKNDHFVSTQEEVEAALASAPNGALFGSSYYRTIPYRLWIWNAFSGSHSVVSKWITKSLERHRYCSAMLTLHCAQRWRKVYCATVAILVRLWVYRENFVERKEG